MANASLVLAILSCSLLWVSVLDVFGVDPQWRFPFVARLIPRSCLPFFCLWIAALLMGVSAVVTGHTAIIRGRRVPGAGGLTWRSLLGALVGYLMVGLLLLRWPSFTRLLVSLGFLPGFVIAGHLAALAAFPLVHIAVTRAGALPGPSG